MTLSLEAHSIFVISLQGLNFGRSIETSIHSSIHVYFKEIFLYRNRRMLHELFNIQSNIFFKLGNFVKKEYHSLKTTHYCMKICSALNAITTCTNMLKFVSLAILSARKIGGAGNQWWFLAIFSLRKLFLDYICN